MKDHIQKTTYFLGFIPGLIYAIISLIFILNSFSVSLLPLIIVTVLLIAIPFCLKHNQYKYFGFILTTIVVLLHFIFASSSYQLFSQTTAFLGIFIMVFYILYYFILHLW